MPAYFLASSKKVKAAVINFHQYRGRGPLLPRPHQWNALIFLQFEKWKIIPQYNFNLLWSCFRISFMNFRTLNIFSFVDCRIFVHFFFTGLLVFFSIELLISRVSILIKEINLLFYKFFKDFFNVGHFFLILFFYWSIADLVVPISAVEQSDSVINI